jgi:biopolymer transport protein ExbD
VVINKIIVTIISEDELYLNDERTSLTSLVDNISSLPEISIGDSRSVIIEGDRRASYSLMVNVLDILRETGFTGINLRMREAGN